MFNFRICILKNNFSDDSESLNEFAFWRRYPWVELFIGIGFFVVYFLDDAIEKICVSDHVHGQKKEVQTTQVQIFNSNLEANNNTEKSEKISKISKLPKISKPIVGAFTLVLALLIHTVLEGFAFGVQNSGVSVTSLFFGIIVHQALLMFSVGMNFAEKIPNNKILATILLIILSAAGPIGTVIGLLIEGSNMSETPKTFVITILNCFSIGCFLFVTFFDVSILRIYGIKLSQGFLLYLHCTSPLTETFKVQCPSISGIKVVSPTENFASAHSMQNFRSD